MKIFKNRSKIKQLEIVIEEKITKIHSLIDDKNELRSQVMDLEKQITLQIELKKQLREQNEADLLFVSLKIIQEILQGKKKEEIISPLEQQSRLMASYRACQRTSLGAYGSPLISALGRAI